MGKHEPRPECSGKYSRYTPKVMFLAAIARSRFDDNSECVLTGRLASVHSLKWWQRKGIPGIDQLGHLS